MQTAAELSDRFNAIMKVYGDAVQIISQKFVYWDKLLSAYDEKLDRLIELRRLQKQQQQQQ